jgi:hypothetical protein
MLRWDWYGFHKKCVGTRYDKVVFLHLLGPTGHVVQSEASGERNVDALFFMIERNRYGFDKMHARTHDAELVFLHSVGSADHVVHIDASKARNIDALFFMLG